MIEVEVAVAVFEVAVGVLAGSGPGTAFFACARPALGRAQHPAPKTSIKAPTSGGGAGTAFFAFNATLEARGAGGADLPPALTPFPTDLASLSGAGSNLTVRASGGAMLQVLSVP